MEKVVKAKCEYNDHLKKLIEDKMMDIQQKEEERQQQSVLNKSIGTVAGILKISKWWK